MLDQNALTVIEGDARISCRRLQEVLGFTRIDSLHKLIRAHEDELNDFGGIFRFEAEKSGRGRRSINYYLNEHQATAICMWAETPMARAGRKLMVEVFTAWRKGKLPDIQVAKADPFETMAGRVRHVADHLLLVGSMDDFALRATNLPMWKNGSRPQWWPNLELRRFLTVAHRQMTLQDARDKAVQTFGVGVPSIAGIQRYWARLDVALGPGRAA